MEKEYACDALGLGGTWTPRRDPGYQTIVRHYRAESASFLSNS